MGEPNQLECDKVANELAKQAYAELLAQGYKNELRTWFIATSMLVCNMLASKFDTSYVAFYHQWNDTDTACTGTLFSVMKYENAGDQVSECVFKGVATVPKFD